MEKYYAVYQTWLNHPSLDSSLKNELENMKDQEIYESFYKSLDFGTAGLRGIIASGTNRMNLYTVRKAALAFAFYLLDFVENSKLRGVVIAYDNRRQSKEFCLASAQVLATKGIKVFIFNELKPTPELSYAVRAKNAAGGIVITASHNPKEYNGFKVYDDQGCQLTPELVELLLVHYQKIENELDILVDENQFHLIETIDNAFDQLYFDDVLKIQLRNNLNHSHLKVVYSPLHGTGFKGCRYILEKGNYNFRLVEEQCPPDSEFSSTRSPNPEEKNAYIKAIELAKTFDSDLILVSDPDGDRIGLGVKHLGEYQLLTGNQTGALMIQYLLMTLKEQNRLPNNGIIFNTIVTSNLGAKIAQKYGVRVQSTLTGFKYIGQKIAQLEKNQEYVYLFGYEESYGYLLSSICRDKDAIQAITFICEMASYYKMNHKNLVQVYEEIMNEFGYFKEHVLSLNLNGSEGALKIQKIMKTFRETKRSELAGLSIRTFENYLDSERLEQNILTKIDLPSSDVVRFVFEDGGYVAIRPSGTEPKCKFYFNVIGKNEKEAQQIVKNLEEAVMKIVDSI